jgi:hypothetical protein
MNFFRGEREEWEERVVERVVEEADVGGVRFDIEASKVMVRRGSPE